MVPSALEPASEALRPRSDPAPWIDLATLPPDLLSAKYTPAANAAIKAIRLIPVLRLNSDYNKSSTYTHFLPYPHFLQNSM